MSEDHLQSNSRSLWFRIGIYENHHYSQFSGFFNILMHSLFASPWVDPRDTPREPSGAQGEWYSFGISFFPHREGELFSFGNKFV